jgi:hypothetical protein
MVSCYTGVCLRGAVETSCLVECDAAFLCELFPTFRKKVLPSSSLDKHSKKKSKNILDHLNMNALDWPKRRKPLQHCISEDVDLRHRFYFVDQCVWDMTNSARRLQRNCIFGHGMSSSWLIPRKETSDAYRGEERCMQGLVGRLEGKETTLKTVA